VQLTALYVLYAVARRHLTALCVTIVNLNPRVLACFNCCLNSTIRYDTIRYTYVRPKAGEYLNLPHGTKEKRVMKKLKTNNWEETVQS